MFFAIDGKSTPSCGESLCVRSRSWVDAPGVFEVK
jgi:hypothetical protein